VASYSRLIGADGGTLERSERCGRELLIRKSQNSAAVWSKPPATDGLLIELGRVVDALRCAVEMQREIARRNAEAEPETLAYHLTESGLPEKAVGYWLRAGEIAVGRRKSTASATGATCHAWFAGCARTSSTRYRIRWQP
jgi:hypothetical protein